LRNQTEPVSGAPGEDHLFAARGADETLDGVARELVELGGLFAQGVDRAMHVRVAPLVIAAHRLEHLPRLLARGTRVEIDERMAVDDTLENRKIRPRELAEPHGFFAPSSACASTDSGRVAQRIRVGRISAWSTASTSLTSSACASPRVRPVTRSATTSADPVEIAEASPMKRTWAMRTPSTSDRMIRTP